MEFLRNKLFLFLSALCLSGCLVNSDGTVTIISPIEADTYISSVDPSDHSELDYLSLYRSGTVENRILLKLPTGESDSDDHLDLCLGNPYCFVFFMPLFILKEIISPNCDDESFTAANLNWAYIELHTEDNSSPAAGSIQVNLLAQSWWHDVSWNRAHPFTKQGLWVTPGGTINNSVSFDPNCTNLQGGQSCGAGEVKFDMTDYLGTLLDNPNSTHFGLVLSFANDEEELRFYSSQSSNLSRPELVANYNCITSSQTTTHRYELGAPLK